MEDGGSLVSEDGSKIEDTTSEKVEKVKEEEDIGKEESGGGLINNLVSTLITPLSPGIGKATENESGADADEDEGENEGGIISKMVSNFFHQSEGEGVVEAEEDKEQEEEIMAGGEKIKRLKTENGGIIHNIFSHLPASIPDGAVPTADEATFLINSLVRD
ncbi:hypothetical protein AAZX31_18G186600 [Glycine max]|uniref:Uncharacterized protein n=2 Tax=Glycine subgen. Soja TaxID=1462606 RepID=K7MTM9_SOYBN|nr:uncharacterized protein LOC102668200 [Glycine max]XP_028213648.1 uncharacterized protein LOC114395971 [Glycine soja]KAG4936926.1 hypothetical protein JHK85_051845 [Glycine max]KAG5092359.1 hypothetical protein JHK82_051137 [Glycine max]KHN40713.1 hypothetical protein glysoja_001211 [Glycine soja]KRH00311.1 hypothetical protein GLYMA_18G205400v4 [Glycine max]RZB52918.1 hypothetical protein D0Y65_049112 [Glycine soja]|eukprot:XP_006602683.1 uncharacterized protein LOC102668200 [Glycine max]